MFHFFMLVNFLSDSEKIINLQEFCWQWRPRPLPSASPPSSPGTRTTWNIGRNDKGYNNYLYTFFGVVFVPRFARYKNSTKKVSNFLEKVKFPNILLFIPTYTYRRCIVSFMPQYYFSMKLIAKKKRQVKIRQIFHSRFGA